MEFVDTATFPLIETGTEAGFEFVEESTGSDPTHAPSPEDLIKKGWPCPHTATL